MSAAGHDDVRAAAALIVCRSRRARSALLGADPDEDRCAAIACVLADWLAQALRETGTDPKEVARRIVAASIRAEATEGAP